MFFPDLFPEVFPHMFPENSIFSLDFFPKCCPKFSPEIPPPKRLRGTHSGDQISLSIFLGANLTERTSRTNVGEQISGNRFGGTYFGEQMSEGKGGEAPVLLAAVGKIRSMRRLPRVPKVAELFAGKIVHTFGAKFQARCTGIKISEHLVRRSARWGRIFATTLHYAPPSEH